jgi:arabinose-5-phosphate isomerase
MTVVRGGLDEVVGIITDGDLRRYIQKNGLRDTACAQDLMTSSPKWVSEKALAVEARGVLEANSIQQLLVKDEGGRLVGVLHLYDLMKARVL